MCLSYGRNLLLHAKLLSSVCGKNKELRGLHFVAPQLAQSPKVTPICTGRKYDNKIIFHIINNAILKTLTKQKKRNILNTNENKDVSIKCYYIIEDY